MDNRASEIVSECLCNHVILEKIMENFSNTGLLKLSLVNKLWNHEAKRLMRGRGNLCPSFKLYQRPMCEQLAAFASDLGRMTVVPFSGMKIQHREVNYHKCCNSSRNEALDPSYNVILDRLPWKQFSIDLDNSFARHHKCATIQLAKRVMREFSEVFEELSVGPNFGNDQFLQEFQDLHFTSLKILEFERDSNKFHIELIKAFVSRAPNLQELRTNLDVSYMAEVLQGSSAVVVPSMFCPNVPHDNLPEGFANVLRVERMALLASGGDSRLQCFNRTIPVLWQTHLTTLNYLRIHVAYLGPLMSSGISLPNVKQFQIDINFQFEHFPLVVPLLKAFDFTRILPGLTTVDIPADNNPHSWIPKFLEQRKADRNEPMLDRAANISHLCLIDCLNTKTAPFLAEILPNIEKLSVKQIQSPSDIPIGLIWEHWTDIKKLEITNRGESPASPFQRNYDGILCGIFPEEAAELLKKDDEFIKSVRIVPVMPSIACFKNLTSHEQLFACNVAKNPTAFWSRVAGLSGFARCPNLSVTVQVDLPTLEEALGHMKLYATVVLERFKWNTFD